MKGYKELKNYICNNIMEAVKLGIKHTMIVRKETADEPNK